jgi:hypothetical protein
MSAPVKGSDDEPLTKADVWKRTLPVVVEGLPVVVEGVTEVFWTVAGVQAV